VVRSTRADGNRKDHRNPRTRERPAGIPLLAACSPETVPADRNALDRATRWLVALELKPLGQVRADISARLTRLIAIEHWLWQLAAAYGGPADRIPYAFRLRALAWFWTPDAHAPGLDANAVCIRCGEIVPPTTTGRPRRKAPPLCAHCAKERPAARTWLERAVAPDGGPPHRQPRHEPSRRCARCSPCGSPRAPGSFVLPGRPIRTERQRRAPAPRRP
jgi:hypothetical protein